MEPRNLGILACFHAARRKGEMNRNAKGAEPLLILGIGVDKPSRGKLACYAFLYIMLDNIFSWGAECPVSNSWRCWKQI